MGTKGKKTPQKKKRKKRVDKNVFVRAVKEYNTPLTPKERKEFLDMIHYMSLDDLIELLYSHYGGKEERRLLVVELLIRNLD